MSPTRMLSLALLGSCPVQLQELKNDLDKAMTPLARDAVRMAMGATDDQAALPAGLADYDLVLLTGLETPACAQCAEKAVTACGSSHEAADVSMRAALALAGISYRVLYGTAAERLAHALQALEGLLPQAANPRPASSPRGLKKQPWVWMCDKCSDPECEHRLLTALLAERGRSPRPY